MIITNKFNLPQPLVDAITNRPYDAQGSYITATSMLQPPLIRQLQKIHADEIEEDAIDRIWSLVGDIGHAILEKNTNTGLSEKRIFIDIDGRKVSGQFDHLSFKEENDKRRLFDYKFTSAWAVVFGKSEWEQQLNILDYLLFTDGHYADSLHICALIRDWNKHEAKRNEDYPQKQCVVIDIPQWSRDDQELFIARRMAMHVGSDEGIIPECNDVERWYSGTKFAAMKKDAKRATRVFESEQEAEAYVADADPKAKLVIVKRTGENRRCENYCNVAQWCPVYERIQAEKAARGDEE